MSVQNIPTERICYVHCNFCNTILAVSVPWSSWTAMVTVRCGHCSNLLSVNVGALLPLLDFQKQPCNKDIEDAKKEWDSSSARNKNGTSTCTSLDSEEPIKQIPPIRPPEKRQRVPSAYNNFIREEIQRIKACNPKISHREAFSTAAKNWAHFPHMHCELKLEESKQS